MAEDPKYRMLVYRTENIGDTVQAIAISRLLPQTVGIVRDEPDLDCCPELPAVVNGFLYSSLRRRLGDNCLFAGIYLYSKTPIESFLPWLKASPWPIGARDPWTAEQLQKAGLKNVQMIGCPSMTFSKYEGPRKGSIAVDVERDGEKLTHLGWRGRHPREQWVGALALLDKYRKAEIISTNRLHVALPSMAFGTPLKFVREMIFDDKRLSLLDHLLVDKGRMEKLAETYRDFLSVHLGIDRRMGDPRIPIFLE